MRPLPPLAWAGAAEEQMELARKILASKEKAPLEPQA